MDNFLIIVLLFAMLVGVVIVPIFFIIKELFTDDKKIFNKVIGGLIVLTIFSLVIYSNTASFQRVSKNIESDLSGGIPRELLVYDANGKLIFELYGRFDFTYDDVCIEYINLDTGLKHNIFPGRNASVLINEVKND